MKRRSFLKLLAGAVAVAVVKPTALLPPQTGGVVAAEDMALEFAAYDLLPPSCMIYPVFTPLRNCLPRVPPMRDYVGIKVA